MSLKAQHIQPARSLNSPQTESAHSRRGRGRTIVTAVLISLLFLLPTLLGIDPPHQEPSLIGKLFAFTLPLCCLGIFILNYGKIVPATMHDTRPWRFIGINAALVILLCAGIQLLHAFVWVPSHTHVPPRSGLEPPMPNFLFRDMLFMLLAVALAYSLRSYEERVAYRHSRVKAEANARTFEIKYLRMQLNPHFLFNTLNNIYALTTISPDKAREAILHLGAMLRYLIYETTESTVPLRRELEIIQDYISLWRLRLEPGFRLTVEIAAPGSDNVTVPPLLLLTLVENCFKHCDKASPEAFITLSISSTADRALTARLTNSFEPESAVQAESKKHHASGIGLHNIRQQLPLLYSTDNYTFSAAPEGKTFEATLTILPSAPDCPAAGQA